LRRAETAHPSKPVVAWVATLNLEMAQF
jgi:hypothetical protein